MSAGSCPSFSFDYELKVRDLQEFCAADRPARKLRARLVTGLAVFAALGAVVGILMLAAARHLGSCQLLIPGFRSAVWQWTCGTAAPLGVAWACAALLAVDVLCWFRAAGAAVQIWRLSPQRIARSRFTSPGVAGRHRDVLAADGVTAVGPDGTKTLIPWPVLTRMEETKTAFILIDQDASARYMLPKHALGDRAANTGTAPLPRRRGRPPAIMIS